MSLSELIHTNLVTIQSKIKAKCLAGGRSPEAVRLVAVTKTRSLDAIKALIEAGCHDLAENYVQEALPKIVALETYPLTWHFIGRMQSNKVKSIAAHFAWVHTITDHTTAEALHEHRPTHLPPLNVCIQVNISKETSKAGIAVSEIADLGNKIAPLSHLRLRGLMTIAEDTSDEQKLQQTMLTLKQHYDLLQQHHTTVDTLSMGMSQDYLTAIQCGSTLVRIGTNLFGPRE